MMLLVGSILLPAAGLDAVDEGEWAALIARLGDALRPADDAGHRAGEGPTEGGAP
jgi:hypothetical protein